MGVSILYTAIPVDFANVVRSDERLKDVFIAIYGYGSGIEHCFSELDQDEIDEITEGLSREDIERLKELIRKTSFGEEASIEKTYELHVAGLEKYFESRGIAEPAKTADLIVGGNGYKLSESILGCDASEVQYISSLLSGHYGDILSGYSFKGPYGDELWKKAISHELYQIIACYESANKFKGEVWIGFL